MGSQPLASVIVSFSRPVTGRELIAIVEELSNRGVAEYFASSKYFDDMSGDTVIGRYSMSADRQLIVVPSTEQRNILPDETYRQIVVMNYDWPGMTFAVHHNDSDVIKSVHEFAVELEQHFAEPPTS